MKKRFFLLTTIIFLSSLTYSATVEESLNSIEAKFNDLLKKEEARKEQLRAESVVLEKVDQSHFFSLTYFTYFWYNML